MKHGVAVLKEGATCVPWPRGLIEPLAGRAPSVSRCAGSHWHGATRRPRGDAMSIGVLFCDQVGSTELLTRLGDALSDEVRRDLFAVLRRPVTLARGRG